MYCYTSSTDLERQWFFADKQRNILQISGPLPTFTSETLSGMTFITLLNQITLLNYCKFTNLPRDFLLAFHNIHSLLLLLSQVVKTHCQDQIQERQIVMEKERQINTHCESY